MLVVILWLRSSDDYKIEIQQDRGENSTDDTTRYTYTNRSMGTNKDITTLTVEPVSSVDYKREFCCSFTNPAGTTDKCIALKGWYYM